MIDTNHNELTDLWDFRYAVLEAYRKYSEKCQDDELSWQLSIIMKHLHRTCGNKLKDLVKEKLDASEQGKEQESHQ